MIWRHTHNTARRRRSLPRLEELESRMVLACDQPAIINGTLTLNCAGEGNIIDLEHSGSHTVLNRVVFNIDLFSRVAINGGSGRDRFNLHATARAVEYNGRGGRDTVQVGFATLQNILAAVHLINRVVDGFNDVTIGDGNYPGPRTMTLNATSLTGFGQPSITWIEEDLASLTIDAGLGGNTMTIAGTPAHDSFPLTFRTGLGTNTVHVQRTSRPIYLDNAGTDTFRFGLNGSLNDFRHSVEVRSASGSAHVILDDSATTAARTVRLDQIANYSYVDGIGAGRVSWATDRLRSLTIFGGRGGNTFTVANTPLGGYVGGTTTTLHTGTGADRVVVQRARGPLEINGQNGRDRVELGNAGSLQEITGAVRITNASSYTDLVLDDSANAAARTATINAAEVTGLAPATISYVQNDLASFTVSAGPGGNTFTVASTPVSSIPGGLQTVINSGPAADHVGVRSAAGRLEINGQGGRDRVELGEGGSVQGITAPVSVRNSPWFTDLVLNDGTSTVARTATLSATEVVGLAPATISYVQNDLASLTVWGSRGGNTFTVINTPASTVPGGLQAVLNSGAGLDRVLVQRTTGPLEVNGQDGRDRVEISQFGSVQGIAASLTVRNTYSFTDLILDNSADALARTVTLSAAEVTGLAPARISYVQNDLASFTVSAGPGGNTFTVANTPTSGFPVQTFLNSGAGVDRVFVQRTTGPLEVNGQDGRDRVEVSLAGSVQSIAGRLTVRNTSSFSELLLDDAANTAVRNVTLTASAVTGLAPTDINFVAADLLSLEIRGGRGNSTYRLSSLSTISVLTLRAGLGTDRLIAPDTPNTWDLIGTNIGTLNGRLSYSGIEDLIGGAANDQFRFSEQYQTGDLDGGSGDNTLVYSNLASGVVVNLPLRRATGIGGTVDRIAHVIGGTGNDILVGDDNRNTLDGGPGRDLLIGGGRGLTLQPDVLLGGLDDDIVIAGFTAHDLNPGALVAILAEWNRPGANYITRCNNLFRGVGGVPALNPTTVTSNRAANTVTGGVGLDLSFAAWKRDVFDSHPKQEYVIRLR